MMGIEGLTVRYHGAVVGTLSMTPDEKLCAFEYDKVWLAGGFSISPLELPLCPGLFVAKPQPFYGNFGVFEDSLPDGYGRYLLHKALLKEGIDDRQLSALDYRLMNGKYFTTRRFDIDGNGERVHVARLHNRRHEDKAQRAALP